MDPGLCFLSSSPLAYRLTVYADQRQLLVLRWLVLDGSPALEILQLSY